MQNKTFLSVSLSVVVSFLFVYAAATASTTISTNISTDGTLTVTGTSALTGNVGVGGSASDYDLDVTGLGRFSGLVDASNFVATSTTATTTLAGGLSVAGTTGLNVLQNGNVGIGTTTPAYKFTVDGTTGYYNNAVYNTSSALQIGFNLTGSSTVASHQIKYNHTGGRDLLIFAYNSAFYYDWQGYANNFWFMEDGRLGIRTSTPGSALSVGGSPGNGFTGKGNVSIGANYAATAAPTNGLIVQGLVGFGTTTPNNIIDIYSTTKSAIGFSGASGDAYKWTIGMDVSNGGRFAIASSTALGTTDRLVIDGTGNVGIGTSSPASQFHVSNGASATTTVEFGAQSTGAKTCFNVRDVLGAATSFYFTGTTMVVEANRCR